MKKGLLSMIAMAVLMAFSAVGFAQTTYTRVSNITGLTAGEKYLIVGIDEVNNPDLGYCAMGYDKGNNRFGVQVTEDGGTIEAVPAMDENNHTDVYEFTLGNSDGYWTFYDELKAGYLYAANSNSNQLKTKATLDDNGKWAITFNADGTATVVAQGTNTRNHMRFNENHANGDPLFNCYAETSTYGTLVAFYKAGTATIQPEPSNYPTNFAATTNNLTATLTWTDATGAQLPNRYLVVGSKGSITVPTDGVAVADGDLVKNVGYGVQTVTFTGLDKGATYHFAIFPYTNGGENIDYKTNGSYPTVNVTTENYYFFEDFDEEIGRFSQYSVTGEQVWLNGVNNGVTFAKMTGYVSGTAHANETWLMSPAIEMPVGASYVNLEFRTAKNYEGNGLMVKVSDNYSGAGDPTAATWTDLTDFFDLSDGSWHWVVDEADIKDYVNNNFFVAFVYTSTDEAAATWEVDYVKITTDGTVGIGETVAASVNVYPNPAYDKVSFTLASDAQVSVFDMTGRMVGTMNMRAGEANYNVADFESGVYFLNIRYADGKKEVARFVKF